DPVACDLLGDRDLRAAAQFVELRGDYPGALQEALGRMADAPFIYTGGLENHPDLVDRLARVRPLLGNPGAVLRRARDPVLLAEIAREAGASPPETRRGDDPPRNRREWLVKPVGGAGGRGIRPAARFRSTDSRA